MFRRILVRVLFCLVTGSVTGPFVWGEPERKAPARLTDVVVTATRDAAALDDVPVYGEVMSSEELRFEKSVRSVPEALKYQTGTMIQKTGHGQGSPYIRGFTGFRNLLLIDGIRLNNSVFRDGPNQYWNTVDAQSLSRIECVRGPFSVLYGSDAVGGTINAITRGGVDMPAGSDWARRLYYRYATAEASHIGRAESIGRVSEDTVISLGYTVKSFGDLRGGSDVGVQEKTGYDEQDYDVKAEYFLANDTWLAFAHQGVRVDDAWRTHQTIYGIDWEGLSVGSEKSRILEQDRKLTYLQYHNQKSSGFCDEFHVGVSQHLQKEERYRERSGDRFDHQGFEVNTLGAFIQMKSVSSIGDLVCGTEYYHDMVNSFNDTLAADGSVKKTAIQGQVADDATYDLAGVYIQNSLPLGDAVTAIVGCRYDYAAADANAVEDPVSGDKIEVSEDWSSVVASARALYHLDPGRNINLFAGVSQGFRAPNLSDLTRLDSARTDERETPSPNLDPERFISYELGIKAAGKGVTGQLGLFHTDIQDMIVRTPTGRMMGDEYEVTKKNAGDGYVQGLEAEIRCPLSERLTAIGAFTWMDGEVETYPTSDPVTVKEPIDRMMPPTGRIALRWDPSEELWVEGACTMADDATRLSTRDESDTSRIPPGGTPGYAVYDLRAGWRISKTVRVSAALENIMDADYRVHGSGLNEPGRNLVLSADWVF